MNIQTQYNYEKTWTLTNEEDLLRMIKEEIGDADAHGTLLYIKEVIGKSKIITVGTCRFRKKN